MTVNENQGNAINTWLPGDEDNPSAVCLWEENNIPWRNKSAKAGREHRLWNWQAPTVQTSAYSGLAPSAPAHRAWLLLVRCHGCLLGGLFHHLRRRGGSCKQRIQHICASQLPTQQLYLFNAGIFSSSHIKLKLEKGQKNEKWKGKGGIRRLKPGLAGTP